MRKLLACLVILVAAAAPAGAISFMGAPQLVNYQGRLTDPSGNPLADGPHTIQVIIWADSTSTNPIYKYWDSGPTSVTTNKGLFSIRLGEPPQPVLPVSVFTDTSLFMGVTVGADPEIAPRTRLTSAPFAMVAQVAITAAQAGTAYSLDPSSTPAGGTISVFLTSTTSTSPTALGSFTVTAPGAGYLVINASGMMYINADASSTSALTSVFDLGLCSSPGSAATCGGTYLDHYVQDADNADGNNQTPAFSLNETFYVPIAGSYTYYINGATSAASYPLNPWGACNVNVIFVPAGLSISSPTMVTGSETPPSQTQEQK